MDYLLHAHPIAWVALLPFWAFLLRLLAGLFQVDVPSWTRAFVNVVLTGLTAFLVYDAAGFVFLQMFGFKYVDVPTGYGYARWMMESPLLKWEILGLVPGVRYLPIVFALCAGGTLQVLTLLVPFRVGVLLFLVHWGANLGLLALVGLLQTLALGEQSASWGFGSPARSSLKLKAHPGLNTETLKGVLAGMTPKTELDAKDDKKKSSSKDAKGKDAEKPDARPLEEVSLSDTFEATLKDLDPLLASLDHASAPMLSKSPRLEAYLKGGGWWVVLGVLGLFSFCWLISILTRIQKLRGDR